MHEHEIERDIDPRIKDLALWNKPAAKKIMDTECAQGEVHAEVIELLLIWIRENQHRTRRAGLTGAFDDIFTNQRLWGE